MGRPTPVTEVEEEPFFGRRQHAARRRFFLGWRPVGQLGLELFDLCLQVGLVFGQGLLEHLPLFGVHGLGPGREAPCLEPRQLERHLLELGLLVLQVPRLVLDALVARLDAASMAFRNNATTPAYIRNSLAATRW